MRATSGKRAGRHVRMIGATLAVALLALHGSAERAGDILIFLPGTQPGTADTVALPASACASCHASSNGRDVPIHGEWAGGMMAQSARDPVFYAALAITNRDAAAAGDNTGEYCIRCHSPTGWLAARSEDVSGRSLRGTDLDGVQCDYCHRIVDPAHPDSSVPVTIYPVPGYGNGMHMIQSSGEVRRGPREGTFAAHPAARDTFQESGALCGICHDVSNPFLTEGQDRIFMPPHTYAPLERTFSEWLMSDFASEGPPGSCQGCHMPAVSGYAASTGPAPERDDVRTHDLTGGNDFIPLVLPDFWPGLDTTALNAAAGRARSTLGRAALLSGSASRGPGGVSLAVRVTNLTGHKLPTGYPEGRRMWLTVVATDTLGDTVYASGVYDTAGAVLARDPSARVYEVVLGLTDSMAASRGLPAGPSFHFALSDTVCFDNRIPPRGFTGGGYASRLASPVGAAYPDGGGFDDAAYALPSTAERVTATLWYQTMSRDYAEFLRDENEGNPFDWNGWGRRLFDSWERRGRSAPVLIGSLSLAVIDTVTGTDPDAAVPSGYRLDPPFPNPFNGTVRIGYALPRAGELRVDVVDLAGRVVVSLAGGQRPPCEGTLVFSPSALAGGVYIVRMRADGFSSSRKILFIR